MWMVPVPPGGTCVELVRTCVDGACATGPLLLLQDCVTRVPCFVARCTCALRSRLLCNSRQESETGTAANGAAACPRAAAGMSWSLVMREAKALGRMQQQAGGSHSGVPRRWAGLGLGLGKWAVLPPPAQSC